MTVRRWSLALLLVALGAAIAVACGTSRPRFSHPEHLTELACGGPGQPKCLSCASCHAVETGVSKLPSAEVCQRCHAPGERALLAAAPPPEDRELSVARTVSFNHAEHLAMPKLQGQCVPCHGGVVAGESAAPASPFPDMKSCFRCHEHQEQWDRAECAPCHEKSTLSRLMPETFLRHDAAFQRRHGTAAREARAMCQSCHTEASCNDCHDVSQGLRVERREPERIDRRFAHPGDYLGVHAIEAKSQPGRCLSCHTTESCDACHARRGVSGNAVNGASPHPRAWMGSNPNDRDFHGRAARRDILTCAACHDQGPATNCVLCHKVGGSGGNPHPHGWKSARSESAAMCRYCHGG